MMEPNLLAGRRVLLVEDDYFIADELRRDFAKTGAEVLGPVGRVDEALALIDKSAHIDGAVLDVKLHDEMVYPVADALLERGVPFVFATGYERAQIPAPYRTCVGARSRSRLRLSLKPCWVMMSPSGPIASFSCAANSRRYRRIAGSGKPSEHQIYGFAAWFASPFPMVKRGRGRNVTVRAGRLRSYRSDATMSAPAMPGHALFCRDSSPKYDKIATVECQFG